MADIHFEQSCPCGDSIKVSGYTSEVRTQIQTWQNIHTKHANAIAKAIVEAKSKQYTTWPQQFYTSTLTTNPSTGAGTTKQE